MFEDIVKELDKKLDELRAKRQRCEELMEKVMDPDKKVKLSIQYDRIRYASQRAALCLDILEYRASVEISEDMSMVYLTTAKPKPVPACQEKLRL